MTERSGSTADLDFWLPRSTVRVAHRRDSPVGPDALWSAARTVGLADSGLLGRLVRWRIPGLDPELAFDAMFRGEPFLVLRDLGGRGLISGLVGRIWTPHRDYPRLADPEAFRSWSSRGTARVLFANWVEPHGSRGSTLFSETRVEAFGAQGRIGLTTLRPVIRAFHGLIATDGLGEAARRAEADQASASASA